MDPKAFRNKGAFSIAELLIAISLLAVVVLALYSIFSQTQKAFRSSINQVDVNEGGRAAMGILVRDLERAVATGLPINKAGPSWASRMDPLAPNLPELAGIGRAQAAFQETYFLTRHPEQLNRTTVQGYFVADENDPASLPSAVGRMGTLYRFNLFPIDLPNFGYITNRAGADNGHSVDVFQRFFNLPAPALAPNRYRTNSTRVIDGVVLFRVTPCDASGRPFEPLDPWFRTNFVDAARSVRLYSWLPSKGVDLGLANGTVTNPIPSFASSPFVQFRTNSLPSFLDVELGVLEPSIISTYRSILDQNVASDFLRRNFGKIQLFRQRVTLRSAPTLKSDLYH